jgi:succinate dehydrogenase / fumarate reductase cytochrome b subunit
MGAPAVPHRWALTVIDIVLGVSVALHIGSAAELALRARRARPVRYAGGRPRRGYASRTMRTGAVLVVVFVAYHLLDLTFLVINRKGIAGDPYDNVVTDFSNGWVVASYAVCLIVLGLHIRHGVWSALQTLGRNNARRQRAVNVFAVAFSMVLIVSPPTGRSARRSSSARGWPAARPPRRPARRLPGHDVLLSGQPPPRPQRRSSGRHQRG